MTILPLMIETLTSKEGMDVNERLYVNSCGVDAIEVSFERVKLL